MNDTSPGSLALRFFPGGERESRLFRRAVEDDISGAVMSSQYRLYYRIRRLVPVRLRRLLQRQHDSAVTGDWYIPNRIGEILADAFGGSAEIAPILHPWPHGKSFALVLTHDVEEAEGLRRVSKLADLEEEMGFRSCWNIVPHRYPVDHGLLRDLRARGFEIGVHGYNHDGKLFLSHKTFHNRVEAIHRALAEFQAVGFRAPMVHRNLHWMQALDVEYDASCFDVDPLQAMPGGVQQVWPFIAGRFVELPYTLPQDHSLFYPCRAKDDSIWRNKLTLLRRLHGMALMLTHPDYLDSAKRLAIYRNFLEQVKDTGGFWHALPRDVARWWRRRDESDVEWNGEYASVHGPAAEEATIVRPRLDGNALLFEEVAAGVKDAPLGGASRM
ncbi:MAG: hypothetical protein KDA42_00165 [Planctomycetales bacterium]|nr:hypothetical protein [Planctomycetales bacterium]